MRVLKWWISRRREGSLVLTASALLLFAMVWGPGCGKREASPPSGESTKAPAGEASSPSRSGAGAGAGSTSSAPVAGDTVKWRASSVKLGAGDQANQGGFSAAADSSQWKAEAATRVLSRAAEAMHLSDEERNRVIVGHATAEGPRGEFEVDLSSTPDGRLWFRQKYPGKPSYVVMITSQGVFGLNEMGERTEISGRDMLLVKSHNFQRIAIEPRVFADRLAPVGEEKYHDVVCVGLRGFTPDNTSVVFFYRKNDGRPAGYRFSNSTAPDQHVEVYYRNWTQVDGADLPSEIVASDDQGEFVFKFSTLTFEDLLPPSKDENKE